MTHRLLVRGTACAALTLAAAGAAWAQQQAAQQQALVPAQSEISFTSRQMGVPVDGRFGKFSAQIQFNPRQPQQGRIGLQIDLTSVQIGAPETMAELRKPGWFDSARVPNASFTSTAITAAGPGKFNVAGTLAIKGISQAVTVPVTLTQQGGITRAEGAFALKRLDFKVGDGEWNDTSLVGNEVQVRFKLALTGVAPL